MTACGRPLQPVCFVTDMITRRTALSLLKLHLATAPALATHCSWGHVMKHLAQVLDEDIALWEIVGICHDLDFGVTQEDRSRHGILSAHWLGNDLPPQALLGIRSHDHRMGVSSETPSADALKLADTLAVAEMQSAS